MFSEIDVNRLSAERQRMTCYALEEVGILVTFDQEIRETALTRQFAATPFVPASDESNSRTRGGYPAHPDFRPQAAH